MEADSFFFVSLQEIMCVLPRTKLLGGSETALNANYVTVCAYIKYVENGHREHNSANTLDCMLI